VLASNCLQWLGIITVHVLLAVPGAALAQAAAPANPAAKDAPTKPEAGKLPAAPTSQKSELAIRPKGDGNDPRDFLFKLGERLEIKATGSIRDRIVAELQKPAASRKLTLYLDSVPMAKLPSSPVSHEAGSELTLNFFLLRDANEEENRKAWDTLLSAKDGHVMKFEPALAVGNELPMSVHSEQDFKLYVAPRWLINTTFFSALAIFLVGYYLIVRHTDMLRDSKGGYYSLGKSQMAFWGFIVVLAFLGVWITTGSMERIPPQALILLGISGATGLSAIFIGNTKKGQFLEQRKKLLAEEQTLRAQQAAAPAAFTPEQTVRLAAIPVELQDLRDKLLSVDPPKGFWRDICNGGHGPTFHRLQVVIWTMVLGVVFVRTVAEVLSMPEFPETLLILMGISNATYLGFKVPEPV
jgi:hypothetical protein